MFQDLKFTAFVFTPADIAVLVFFLVSWFGMGLLIEREGAKKPSTHILMRDYRQKWMMQMVTREPRIFDSQILSSLRQGASFFMSACMIAIGGGVALLGQAERLQMLASDISSELNAPLIVWEAKIMLILLVLGNAFLKFVWSVRLFGYCAVLMAAVPNDVDDPETYPMADKAAKLNIFAARSFNRGLRAVYFALAALLWLLGPLAFFLATLVTVWMLYRREYNSQSRSAILGE